MAQQQQQQSHVPKFGNWDSDNTPYTIFFENARKERTGGGDVRMNPNDPEAFAPGKGRIMNPNDPEDNPEAFTVAPPSPLHVHYHDTMYDEPKSSTSSSHARNKSDYSSQRASVPRFGAWEERDPRSGDGFTVLFNKVKEEKHMPSVNFPVPPHQSAHFHAQQHYHTSSPRSKRCCCFF